MSSRAEQLLIEIASKADSAGITRAADDLGHLSRAADDAGATAEKSGRKLTYTADQADDLGGKAGKATGALGALSSGFELVGLEKYAGALQGASLATDFFSGVGDSLNLVMESTIVKTAKARVQAVGHAIATKAQTAATIATTAAQKALNLAMRANPIGLVITAILLLVAGFTLAYKKSETFRNIVNGALQAVGHVVGSVVEGVQHAFGRMRDGFEAVGRAASWVSDHVIRPAMGVIGRVVGTALSVFAHLLRAISHVPGMGWVGKLADKFEHAADKARGLDSAVRHIPNHKRVTVFYTVATNVTGPMANKVKAMDNPMLQNASPRVMPRRARGGNVTFNTHIHGAVDPVGTGRQVDSVLRRRGMLLGAP